MTNTDAPSYAFIDCETTSLHPETGQIWELALILRDPGAEDRELLWQLPVNLEHADPFSLDIGGYWDRRWPSLDSNPTADATPSVRGEVLHGGPGTARRGPGTRNQFQVPDMDVWAEYVAGLLRGRYLVGNVVAFDAERLASLLRWHGQMPTWHYHIIDVEAVAAGALGMTPPWSSAEITHKLGVPPPEGDARHTALGDTRWAEALWDAAVALRA